MANYWGLNSRAASIDNRAEPGGALPPPFNAAQGDAHRAVRRRRQPLGHPPRGVRRRARTTVTRLACAAVGTASGGATRWSCAARRTLRRHRSMRTASTCRPPAPLGALFVPASRLHQSRRTPPACRPGYAPAASQSRRAASSMPTTSSTSSHAAPGLPALRRKSFGNVNAAAVADAISDEEIVAGRRGPAGALRRSTPTATAASTSTSTRAPCRRARRRSRRTLWLRIRSEERETGHVDSTAYHYADMAAAWTPNDALPAHRRRRTIAAQPRMMHAPSKPKSRCRAASVGAVLACLLLVLTVHGRLGHDRGTAGTADGRQRAVPGSAPSRRPRPASRRPWRPEPFTTDPAASAAQYDDLVGAGARCRCVARARQIAGCPDQSAGGRRAVRVLPALRPGHRHHAGTGQRHRHRACAPVISSWNRSESRRAARSAAHRESSTSSGPRTAVGPLAEPAGAHLLAPARSELMRGMTLVELLVAWWSLVAVLAALVAIPSYRSHVLRTHRVEARTALLALAAAQEKFFLQHNTLRHAGGAVGRHPRTASALAGDQREWRGTCCRSTVPASRTTSATATATRRAGGGPRLRDLHDRCARAAQRDPPRRRRRPALLELIRACRARPASAAARAAARTPRSPRARRLPRRPARPIRAAAPRRAAPAVPAPRRRP